MKNPSDQNQQAGSATTGRLKQIRPVIIAGPCSAETPEQLMTAARALALDERISYFRAGIWKPRTTPDSFQGAGSEGLVWLHQVKVETGLKTATEVGSEKHVDEALKAGVDLLWIGARTVSNPFVIQGIADALRGVDIPVLVKNPLSADIDLWEGAITRLLRVGLQDVGAIHRGFFWPGKSALRNQPLWHVPLELRNRMPELPIIGDPSHIAGKREFVAMLANRAIENDFAGLMIEVHPNPEKAWSDAAQQLTPESFFHLLDNLFGGQESTTTSDVLDELRQEVDTMDEMIIWTLSQRMKLAGKIANVKKEAGLNSLQPGRWLQVLNKVKTLAAQSELDPHLVERIYHTIHQHSLSLQNGLLKSDQSQSKKEHTFVF